MGEDERAGRTTARAGAGPLLSIGVFARRSRLSPKALRLYDQSGLLAPAQIDQGSGYRWYRESQLATARLIALLRRLDMPLTQIAAVVADPGPHGAAVIAAYWTAVERRLAAQRVLAAYLQAKLAGEERSATMLQIHEREVPEQVVLTEQRHVHVGDLPAWIGAALGRLLPLAQGCGGVAGAPFVVYHGEVTEDSDGPVEVCVPIDPAQAAPGVAARPEPAHREAYVTLRKAQVAYPQILTAYDAVAHWISAQGRQSTGSPREVYFADFGAAAPDDAVCDVAFPMA